MDQTTIDIKNMYEDYPYPAGEPDMRAGFDVRLLLSYVESACAPTKQLHALDAGCGRGLGLIGAAVLQPEVRFLGADINQVGLADAQHNAAARGLKNIGLVQADLMTLEGIEIPPGGFDVIYSSGVLHHLSDPATGLKNLRQILAPQGVISLMLYGSYGRQALYRLVESIDLLAPKEQSIGQRLPAARLLAQAAEQTIFTQNFWSSTAQVNEVEFVDRCLNVNETSYTIETLCQLLDNAQMKIVRWTEPDDWSVSKLFHDQQLRTQLNNLSPMAQYQIIERLFERPKLELIICKAEHNLRAHIPDQELDDHNFALNPEISLLVEKRNLNQSQRIESLCYKLKAQEPQKISDPLLAQTLMLIIDQTTSFSGKELFSALASQGVSREEMVPVLRTLFEKEILFSPH
ncbi:MAG: class I SAM-dependent methyltransferase [Geopsychrobacter sp.]|nr:class I SAM-dependent methyltransferase [Geopsychrobacter sp.]